MEKLSKTLGADAPLDKDLCPPPASSGMVSDSLSSYREYPAQRPFITIPKTRTHQSSCRPSSPIKAFPETSSAEILSALRSLQEKLRRLELEKGQAELRLHTLTLQGDRVTQRGFKHHTDTEKETRGQSNCNQVLVGHLAAAEARCVKLERQLDHMRRMLCSAKADRTSLLKQQVSMETAKSADQQSERAQLEKLERLEQEYLRLTRTQTNAEIRIRELEMKLLEEEHQRKLVQDRANQLQAGIETNRMLLRSVSPHLSSRREKKSSYTQPHYRLSLRDVPFVAGTSVGCSHSVRANVQSVLSLLKRHQPHLCNSRVLSNSPNGHRYSDGSSSSTSTSMEELSELLRALQEELRLMTLEQDELMRQMEDSVSDEERRELEREQETLLLKMERKGEQIRKLCKHQTQIKKLRQEANRRRNSGHEGRMGSTRGRSDRPGERSKKNLRLLRDMRALQNSLRT